MNRNSVIWIWLAASPVVFAGDPFADVRVQSFKETEVALPWWKENLLFRKEWDWMWTGGEKDFRETESLYSRLSAGFEIQKRFATATKTVASINYQGRLVYRDHLLNTAADPMGMDADAWEYETHNAVAEFYQLAGEPGKFNLRVGRYYLPFGLNSQTDTHGTLLQLSNERVFGTDRDWQLTAFGNATEMVDYMAGVVLGSGPHQDLHGQSGMAVGRVGLGSTSLFEQGLEGGVSGAFGERVVSHSSHEEVVETWRAGADIRKRMDTGYGPFTFTGEGALGQDDHQPMASGLVQADWLHPGRQWGLAAQYFYFEQEGEDSDSIDERASFVATRYFRNDVGNSSLHWIALGVEEQIRVPTGDEDTMWTVQYYRYW